MLGVARLHIPTILGEIEMAVTKTRYKTGEKCLIKGNYDWDGYEDGTRTPSPTVDERCIPLEVGETFPPIRSCDKACYRVFAS